MSTTQPQRTRTPWLLVVPIVMIVVTIVFLTWPKHERRVEGDLGGSAVAFQTVDSLRVVVNLDNPGPGRLVGPLAVELLEDDGRVIARGQQPINQAEGKASHAFDLGVGARPAGSLRLRWHLGDRSKVVALSDALLVKAHETRVSTGTEFHAGTTAAVRCEVRGVKSLLDTVPLPGSTVAIVMLSEDEKQSYPLYKGTVDDAGKVLAPVKVPEVASGPYKLRITTASDLGRDTLDQRITVKAEPRVLLTTDKPLYQPGQLIRLRALALAAGSLQPIGKSSVLFEIEDGKGNVVFQREEETSAHGIASADFQLANEVNTGDYQIRVKLGRLETRRTVTVKPYVLPKFKSELKADRNFYQPGDTIKATLKTDYVFGKPVAGARVKVSAQTFDVEFREFTTWEGKTDADGGASFSIELPKVLVGHSLLKGDSFVRLEATVTDGADHSETVGKNCTVSDAPLKVSLIPEGGTLRLDQENRVFVATLTPDGRPVACAVEVDFLKSAGRQVKTNKLGLGEFTFTPQRRDTQEEDGRNVPVRVAAQDDAGVKVNQQIALNARRGGDNVLLRLDKAIYKAGDVMQVTVHSSAGLPRAYLDVVRDGQVLLTDEVAIKDGKGSAKVVLPPDSSGTIEVHAYQMLGSGTVVRDGRVAYVRAADELKITVQAKAEYRPGEDAVIRFEVTDAGGNPRPAALGLVIVDEAVYALQDMQPGLEKVYFTLQEELLKPRVQADYRPATGLPEVIRENAVSDEQQQAAAVLLTAVQPKPVSKWQLDRGADRARAVRTKVEAIAAAVWFYGDTQGGAVLARQPDGRWIFHPDLFDVLCRTGQVAPEDILDTFHRPFTPELLREVAPSFTPDGYGIALTRYRMRSLPEAVTRYCVAHKGELTENGTWKLPDDLVERMLKQDVRDRLAREDCVDAWGQFIRVVPRGTKDKKAAGSSDPLADYRLTSAGPDGVPDTADDVGDEDMDDWWNQARFAGLGVILRLSASDDADVRGAVRGSRLWTLLRDKDLESNKGRKDGGLGERFQTRPDAIRVRDYFPETMLWHPGLITDDRGRAELSVRFADSITTWRLSASAHGGGLLGSTSVPLRAFQPFFVDFDLPVALTRNDEVTVPVAAYNYLDRAQKVTVELEAGERFLLLGDGKATQTVEVQPHAVTAVRYRIRATKVGPLTLGVRAKAGDVAGDAVRRTIEVVPDGRPVEQVAGDYLKGPVQHTVTIPANAQDDATKLFVKLYPGVFSQLLEGTEGMLQMPHGCFEQTSSAAYPNVLVLHYLQATKQLSPDVKMKAESYLNAGYQRLLTFEHNGGGFSLYGQGEPSLWLTAYGLQEFSDMAKVWPVDEGVLERSKSFLLDRQDKDGTWKSNLALTAYILHALHDAGLQPRTTIDAGLAQVRTLALKSTNAYDVALAANALVAWEPAAPGTQPVLDRLAGMVKNHPEWPGARHVPADGASLTHSRGDWLTMETTALAALAFQRANRPGTTINPLLVYLVKSKKGGGTWGSTMPTVLALKALVGAARPAAGNATFAIHVGDKEVQRGEITPKNSDVLQQFDLSEFVQKGDNKIRLEIKGESNVMYQIVARHYEDGKAAAVAKPGLDITVEYDRTKLTTDDVLKAKATLTNRSAATSNQVIVDVGIPPGFTLDPAPFAKLLQDGTLDRYTVTAQQVTLYLGRVPGGASRVFEYELKPKYPLKVKTPRSLVYEYYTPDTKASAPPVELLVEAK